MARSAIKAQELGKSYQLGLHHNGNLRETLDGMFRHPVKQLKSRRNKKVDILWALRDLSFDIEHGEVVGLIGHNGAGKSTLLKLLSRITEPSTGYAEITGRVGSLLEVGTGFHPELTGRENIFLNGSILGMRRAEIRARFDEIVEFSEIERFLDTPVKRYSSGMSVRLAFSVAAHLEPEILLIDEVLAVGDASFQRRSMTKMTEVAKEGRTVIFVSHNMGTIRTLCKRGILLEKGQVVADTDAEGAIDQYLHLLERASADDLLERTDRD
jgi:lipopolysaccharide transport system ATP-binding protein